MTHLSPRAIEAIKTCLASKDVTGYINGPEIIYKSVLTALEAEGMVVVPKSTLYEIANRASNMLDPDAAEWMPSIYKIACEAVGEDPTRLLQAAQGGDDAGQ